jgi:hypothetical protein
MSAAFQPIEEETEIFPIYEAYSTDDNGGRRTPIGYATKRSDAVALAKNKGAWGGDGGIDSHYAATINGQCYIVNGPIDLDGKVSEARAAIRAKALEKLSDIEKKVLGLDTDTKAS